MKQVAIDKLLQWAVNDELPKGSHVLNEVGRIIERLAAADRGGQTPYRSVPREALNGCYLEGNPHPDAVLLGKTIHRMSVCYGLADEASARALLGPLAEIDPKSIIAALSVRPDVGALLLSCAVLKRAPHLRLEHPKARPVYRGGDRRRITILRLDADGELVHATVNAWREKERGAFAGAPRCPIWWDDPTIETVALQRAEYTIWWRGMTLLAKEVAGKLRDHVALPLAHSPTPWLDGADNAQAGTLHRLDTHRPMAKLPLRPHRQKAGPPLSTPRASAVRRLEKSAAGKIAA